MTDSTVTVSMVSYCTNAAVIDLMCELFETMTRVIVVYISFTALGAEIINNHRIKEQTSADLGGKTEFRYAT